MIQFQFIIHLLNLTTSIFVVNAFSSLLIYTLLRKLGQTLMINFHKNFQYIVVFTNSVLYHQFYLI